MTGVELTQGIEDPALCDCGHRVTWHHDERGCGYHGFSDNRCPCDRSSEAVVAQIVAARLAPVEAEVAHLRSTFFAECPKDHEHGVWCGSDWVSLKHRAEAAEAEVARLRDAVMGHERMRWPEEAHRLKQRGDRLATVVEAVDALADEWERKYAGHIDAATKASSEVMAGLQVASGSVRKLCADELRAALASASSEGRCPR